MKCINSSKNRKKEKPQEVADDGYDDDEEDGEYRRRNRGKSMNNIWQRLKDKVTKVFEETDDSFDGDEDSRKG